MRAAISFAVLLISLPAGALAQDMPAGVKAVDGVLTDAKGMTLYTFAYDTTLDQSACSDVCLVQWPVLPAAADAKPMGDWTPILRSDGARQWAYKGKPLYTFYQDIKPGDQKGDGNMQIWHTAMP